MEVEGGGRLFSKAPRSPLRFTQHPIQWVLLILSTEAQRPGRRADHSPLSRAMVRNEWSYTPTPPYAFYQEERYVS
jgi:hypothetical protein